MLINNDLVAICAYRRIDSIPFFDTVQTIGCYVTSNESMVFL